MQFQQALEVSTQTDSPRESCASKGVGCGAMHAEQTEDTGANMSNVQLQAAERAQHLERENAGLKQQLKAIESRYDSGRQLIEAQAAELAEKGRVIQALQSKLSRLSNLATAFADEVHGTSSPVTGGGLPPFQSLATRQAQQQQAAAAAPQQKPAEPTATPEQPLNLPAAMAVLTRLHQQHQQQQQSASTLAAAAASAKAAAAAGSAAAAGMRLPSAGSKRGRLCSATGSGGDPTKHAASGGSSSSHQQLSADEELDEDMDDDDDEADDEGATAGCFSAKRSRSPNSCERPVQTAPGAEAAAAAAAAAAEHMDADEDDDKSQDDLDAAQCLQQLAMSAGSGEAQGTNHTGMPSLFDSLSNSDRFAAGGNRGVASNLARWGSSGHTNATLPGITAGPAAGYAGSTSSNGSGGNGGNSSAFNQVVQAHLLNYLGALNPEGFEGFHNPRAQQQGPQAVQQKRLSLPFGSAQQPQAAQPQQQRQHHFGGGLALQQSGSLGASWAAPAKSAPAPAAPCGSMGAPARARKQSWFQTEIAEKIPLSVQQACAHDWSGQQCMQVVCADLCGTFYMNSAGEYLIKLAHSGEVVTPNKFEELAGKKTARNWQQSIRLVGYTMNGEPNSALLKLGHFTRIVGLVQDR